MTRLAPTSYFLLFLYGELLLEHSGVDNLTPLPVICSETPGRVNAGAEVLDVPRHDSQPRITSTYVLSVFSILQAGCSFQPPRSHGGLPHYDLLAMSPKS